MANERGFGDDGTNTTRPYQPDDSDDQMNENDEDVVHPGIGINISKSPGIQAEFVIRHRQGGWAEIFGFKNSVGARKKAAEDLRRHLDSVSERFRAT